MPVIDMDDHVLEVTWKVPWLTSFPRSEVNISWKKRGRLCANSPLLEAEIPMRQILHYRKQFYEKWFDTRVLCGTGDTVEEIAEKVLQAVKRYQNSDSETTVSTRSDNGLSMKLLLRVELLMVDYTCPKKAFRSSTHENAETSRHALS
ncbi:unnamed protein product [Coregonus sp. 'balchen']|nr:unnamed protein product [Coregonus sp. 'balchen']